MKSRVVGFVSILAGVVSYLLTSCVFHPLKDETFEYHQMPNARWEAGHVVKFEMLVDAAQQPYSCDLLLRHNNDYKYTGLKCVCEILLNGKLVESDTIATSIVDKNKRWKGQGISQREVPVKLFRKRRFQSAGIYTIQFKTTLHNVGIPGIESLGFRTWKE